MPHVAIVIVNYNGEADTRECLLSLKKSHKKDFTTSITIVDNGSKDPLHLPEDFLPAQTEIVRSASNLGFTSGNNLGIRYACEHYDPDYILLLNNDTVVDPDFLIHLVECAEQNPKVGMVTPKIYFAPGREFHADSYTPEQKGKVFWYAGGSIDWPNLDAFHRGVDELDHEHFDQQKESDFATGCCVLIPRKVLDRIGLFDARYFLYLEDVDLSIRIRQAGYILAFCPLSKIWHINAGSSGGAGSALHQYYQTRNRLFFFLRYNGVRYRVKGFSGLMTFARAQWNVLRYGFHLILHGNNIERRATLDCFFFRMGKQTIL
jgi:GT2 family glycosyltransferase